MKTVSRNFHGDGPSEHECYEMPQVDPHDYWASVTDVPCPVAGCEQTLVWYEAGYVPGYRVCMRRIEGDQFDLDTLTHRFFADRVDGAAVLIRDECCE